MLILTILLYYIAIFLEDYDPTQSQKPGLFQQTGFLIYPQ